MGGTRKARLLHRVLVVSVFAFSVLVAAAPMAVADPCSPLDLGCVVDDTTTTVGGVVDDTTTTVEGVVDDTTTTVGGVVDDTTTTVEGVVGGGAGQVDPGTILEGVVPSGVVPGGVLPGPGETPSGGGTTLSNGGGTAHTGTASSGSQGTSRVAVATAGPGTGAPGVSGATSTAVGHPFPRFLDDGGALLAGARLVRTLAFPLVLILFVVGFIFVQNRIDRRDPKLALAPVGSEHLTFS